MRRSINSAFIIAAITIAASVSGRALAGETAEKPVEITRIGVCLSLTGAFQNSGKKYLAGVKLRQFDYNARSKRLGKKIDLIIMDDKSDADTATQNLRRLANEEKVAAVIGPLSTNQMLAMRDTARELQIPLVSPSVTSPKIGPDQDWAVRILFDDTFQGTALARYLIHKEKVKTASALINDRLAYSASVFAAFKEELEKLGGKIVTEEHYDWIANEDKVYDFTAHLKKIAKEKPDIVILPVNSLDVAAIIGCSTSLKLGLRFCGGDTWQHENILLSSGNDLEKACFVGGIDFNVDSEPMERFLELFDHSNDPDAQLTSVLGYDALSLVIAGMKNGNQGSDIHKTLYTLKDFRLATGSITIDPEKGSRKSAIIQRITNEDGEFVARIVDEIKP